MSFIELYPSHVIFFRVLEMFPIESLKGTLETLSTFSILWVIFSQEIKTTRHLHILARCLDLTFRSSGILKFINYSTLSCELALQTFNQTETESSELYLKQICLQSLAKIATTFTKPLESVVENVSEFCNPLESLSDERLVESSVILMEALGAQLSHHGQQKQTDKQEVCQRIMDKLAKSLQKSFMKTKVEKLSDQLKILVVRMLSEIMAVSDGSPEIEQWFPMCSRLTNYSLEVIYLCVVAACPLSI